MSLEHPALLLGCCCLFLLHLLKHLLLLLFGVLRFCCFLRLLLGSELPLSFDFFESLAIALFLFLSSFVVTFLLFSSHGSSTLGLGLCFSLSYIEALFNFLFLSCSNCLFGFSNWLIFLILRA